MTNYACPIHQTVHHNKPCPTWVALIDVRDHRAEQVAQYGDNSDLKDGTGPHVRWLVPIHARPANGIEASFRTEYLSHGVVAPDWMHLVREEVAEAFMESDPVRLRAELLQVAALCISWIEQIDQRKVAPTQPELEWDDDHPYIEIY